MGSRRSANGNPTWRKKRHSAADVQKAAMMRPFAFIPLRAGSLGIAFVNCCRPDRSLSCKKPRLTTFSCPGRSAIYSHTKDTYRDSSLYLDDSERPQSFDSARRIRPTLHCAPYLYFQG